MVVQEFIQQIMEEEVTRDKSERRSASTATEEAAAMSRARTLRGLSLRMRAGCCRYWTKELGLCPELYLHGCGGSRAGDAGPAGRGGTAVEVIDETAGNGRVRGWSGDLWPMRWSTDLREAGLERQGGAAGGDGRHSGRKPLSHQATASDPGRVFRD